LPLPEDGSNVLPILNFGVPALAAVPDLEL
jgi:hypothetical protein